MSFFLVVLYHVYVVGNCIRSLVAYPHCHIRILPITSANISAVFLRILPLRRSAHPQIRILPEPSPTYNYMMPVTWTRKRNWPLVFAY